MRRGASGGQFWTTLGICAALGACGSAGGGSSGAGDLTFEERFEAVAQLGEDLGSLFNTGFTGQPGEMPTSGSAIFTGYAVAVFDDTLVPDTIEDLDPDADPALALVGSARLTADFAARTITGDARDFFGKQDGSFDDYEGTIALRDGEIGVTEPRGSSAPNDIRFRYEGTLTGQGNEVALTGDAEGKFKGTPIRGLIAGDVGDNGLNGVARPSFFGVVAERD